MPAGSAERWSEPQVPATVTTDLYDGKPWWLAADPPVDRHPPVPGPLTADVLVVGGGVTGALLADRLTEAGLDVVLVDARQPGQGSTTASSALLLSEIDNELGELGRLIGRGAAVEAYHWSQIGFDALAERIERLDEWCGFEVAQPLYLASRVADLPRLEFECRLRRRAGFDCELWDEARLDRETGLWAPGALASRYGARVDPRLLTEALLRNAIRSGARVFGGTQVTALEGGTPVVARTPGGTITARSVVLATGYEPPAGFSSPLIRYHATFALVTEPTDRAGRLAPFVLWETERPYAYLRTVGPRIMIGGADLPYDDPAARLAALPARIEELRARLGRWLEAEPPSSETEWAGTFSETTDGLPLIGAHPSIPNAWLALAYGGNGITFAALAADLIGRAVLEGHAVPALFAPDRTVPEAP